MAVQTGRQPEALSISKTVQKQRPGETIGYVLEGDIYLQARKWDQALAAFRQGVEKLSRTGAEVGPLAAKIHATLTASKRLAEAQAFASDWLKAHPKDVETRAYLADLALMNGDFAKAEPLYRQVLELAPNHMFAMNNLAWILAKQNRPGALAMVQQAIAASPQSPEPVDTLAFALAQENQLDKAIETAKRAVSMAPNHGRYRFNLAKLYLKAGQKNEAKSELTRLREMGSSFPNQAEVADLLSKT